MLRSKHIRDELINAKKVFEDENADVKILIKSLYKLVQATLKVVANNRLNTARIMEKLGVAKLQPLTKEEGKDKSEPKKEE
jgi:hypothetical protein